MTSLGLNMDRIDKVSTILKKIIGESSIDDFTDPRYYPPPGTDYEKLTMYFLVMVSMDHRLSRPGKPYEAVIDGEMYHGADLLYRLGMKMFSENPDFFTPEYLSRIKEEDVTKWLSPSEKTRPADLKLRTFLLKDLGLKLKGFFNGKAYEIVEKSRGYLRNNGAGFIELVKTFTAYQDPVEKKAFLLTKFLERRNVIPIVDPWNKELPVDNHLTRLAIRWGLVEVGSDLLEKIASRKPFTFDEDVVIRYYARMAFKIVSQKTGVDPFVLDDFLWSFGRTTCKRDEPLCIKGENCPLMDVCRAYADRLYLVGEHYYYDTWYY
jgi:hypothetical protein